MKPTGRPTFALIVAKLDDLASRNRVNGLLEQSLLVDTETGELREPWPTNGSAAGDSGRSSIITSSSDGGCEFTIGPSNDSNGIELKLLAKQP